MSYCDYLKKKWLRPSLAIAIVFEVTAAHADYDEQATESSTNYSQLVADLGADVEAVCREGLEVCGDGMCHDLEQDANHCGACGNVCEGGALCDSGICRATDLVEFHGPYLGAALGSRRGLLTETAAAWGVDATAGLYLGPLRLGARAYSYPQSYASGSYSERGAQVQVGVSTSKTGMFSLELGLFAGIADVSNQLESGLMPVLSGTAGLSWRPLRKATGGFQFLRWLRVEGRVGVDAVVPDPFGGLAEQLSTELAKLPPIVREALKEQVDSMIPNVYGSMGLKQPSFFNSASDSLKWTLSLGIAYDFPLFRAMAPKIEEAVVERPAYELRVLVSYDSASPLARGENIPRVEKASDYDGRRADYRSVAVAAPSWCLGDALKEVERDSELGVTRAARRDQRLCAVELGALERSLVRAGYRVLSWRGFARLADATGAGRSITDVARKANVDVVLMVGGANDAVSKNDGLTKTRWRYRLADHDGYPTAPVALSAGDRRALRAMHNAMKQLVDARIASLTTAKLELDAIDVDTGKKVWRYEHEIAGGNATAEDLAASALMKGTITKHVLAGEKNELAWEIVPNECVPSAGATAATFAAQDSLQAASKTPTLNAAGLHARLRDELARDAVQRFKSGLGSEPLFDPVTRIDPRAAQCLASR